MQLDQPFVVHTRPDCPYCTKVKEAINEAGFCYTEVSYVTDEERQNFKAQGFKTFPQVYHDDKLIGGYDQTSSYLETLW